MEEGNLTTFPSLIPSDTPSGIPSVTPSQSLVPSELPSVTTLPSLSQWPSLSPSDIPSGIPSATPSLVPSELPSLLPSTDAYTDKINSAVSVDQEVSSAALAITLTIYGTLMIAGWLYFELFREKHRLGYSTRDRSEETRNPLCAKKWRFLKWIRPVQTLTDDQIHEYCGLDILMFLRFQRVGIKVAFVGVISAIILLPVYATGGNLQSGKRDQLEYLTMGNVPPGSPRLYASVLAAYAMTLTVLYFVWIEYKQFVDRKHKFMTEPNVHQYSILLEHIPKVSEKLFYFAQKCAYEYPR